MNFIFYRLIYRGLQNVSSGAEYFPNGSLEPLALIKLTHGKGTDSRLLYSTWKSCRISCDNMEQVVHGCVIHDTGPHNSYPPDLASGIPLLPMQQLESLQQHRGIWSTHFLSDASCNLLLGPLPHIPPARLKRDRPRRHLQLLSASEEEDLAWTGVKVEERFDLELGFEPRSRDSGSWSLYKSQSNFMQQGSCLRCRDKIIIFIYPNLILSPCNITNYAISPYE